MAATQAPTVHLRVNVLALFDNAGAPSKNIDFSKTSDVMGGAGARAVADNHAVGLFTLERVTTN